MPASEIDDIFASKGKGKSLAAASSSSSALLLEKKKKKKKEGKEKSAKRKREDNAGEDAAPKPPKRQVPETVFDPSSSLSSSKKSQAGKADKPATNAAKPMRPKMDREEEARFKDSRGTGPRRKTEEGFSIYKEDELGINDEGGDTPLCPFDCQCCF